MKTWFRILIICALDALFILGTYTVHTLNEDPLDTREVCTRSHIKNIPVTQLDGTVKLVPAERCDHYKIEKVQ